MPDRMSGLIWVQTVCKSNQQTTLGDKKLTYQQSINQDKCLYPSILTCVLGAQRNCLVETVLLSTHNMFFIRNKKIIF